MMHGFRQRIEGRGQWRKAIRISGKAKYMGNAAMRTIQTFALALGGAIVLVGTFRLALFSGTMAGTRRIHVRACHLNRYAWIAVFSRASTCGG